MVPTNVIMSCTEINPNWPMCQLRLVNYHQKVQIHFNNQPLAVMHDIFLMQNCCVAKSLSPGKDLMCSHDLTGKKPGHHYRMPWKCNKTKTRKQSRKASWSYIAHLSSSKFMETSSVQKNIGIFENPRALTLVIKLLRTCSELDPYMLSSAKHEHFTF